MLAQLAPASQVAANLVIIQNSGSLRSFAIHFASCGAFFGSYARVLKSLADLRRGIYISWAKFCLLFSACRQLVTRWDGILGPLPHMYSGILMPGILCWKRNACIPILLVCSQTSIKLLYLQSVWCVLSIFLYSGHFSAGYIFLILFLLFLWLALYFSFQFFYMILLLILPIMV